MTTIALIACATAILAVVGWRASAERVRDREAELHTLRARDRVRQRWLEQSRALVGVTRRAPHGAAVDAVWCGSARALLHDLEHRREARPLGEDPAGHAADVRIVSQRMALGMEVSA